MNMNEVPAGAAVDLSAHAADFPILSRPVRGKRLA